MEPRLNCGFVRTFYSRY